MAGEWQRGEQAADAIRFRLNLGYGVADLRMVMRRLGLAFVARDFGEKGGDGRYVKDGDDAVVIINTHVKNSGRVRFTVAHEIGHHVLHGQGVSEISFVDDVVGGGGTKPAEETEADAFAAYFLAPQAALAADTKDRIITFEVVIDLMVSYGVSYQSTVFRLHNSNLIDAPGRDALLRDGEGRIQAALRDQGGIQADDLLLGHAELPETLMEDTLKLYAHGVINKDRLAEMLRVSEDDVASLLEARGVVRPEVPDLDDLAFDLEDDEEGLPIGEA